MLTPHNVRKAEKLGWRAIFLSDPEKGNSGSWFLIFFFLHSLYWPKLGCGLSPLLVVLIGYIPCNSSWGTVVIIVPRLWAG